MSWKEFLFTVLPIRCWRFSQSQYFQNLKIPKDLLFYSILFRIREISEPYSRTADWFGVKRIVCSEDTVDVFNPKVVQSAMGSLVRVELNYTDLRKYINGKSRNIPVYAGSLDGEDLKEKIQLTNAMLLMGNESKGISPDLKADDFQDKSGFPAKGVLNH